MGFGILLGGDIELSPDILLKAGKQTKPIFVMALSASMWLYDEDRYFNLPKGEENLLLRTDRSPSISF